MNERILVQIIGPKGSGKSTIAQIIGKALAGHGQKPRLRELDECGFCWDETTEFKGVAGDLSCREIDIHAFDGQTEGQHKSLQAPHPKTSFERFFSLLDQAPRIARFWNKSKRALEVDDFDKALPFMSHGEQVLAEFFASVWFGNDERYPFRVMDAMTVLDTRGQKIILEWVADPFYP